MNTTQQETVPPIRYSAKIVILICLALAFAVMNGTMFNIALPDIADTFALTTTQISWMVTSFTTVFAIGTLIYGKLADIFPVRTLYSFGIGLLALGGLVGLLANSFELLIAGRIIQAMGAASVPSLSFILPAKYFPEHRGQMFGYLAATIAFSSGIGPIIGGLVGGLLHWRYIFLFSVVSALSIPLFRKWLPQEARQTGRIDYIGALLVAIVVTSLLFVITNVSGVAAVIGIACSILLNRRIRTVANPFIEPSLFKNRHYMLTLLTSFFGTAIVMGLIFTIPLMLRAQYGSSTIEIGLILFPGAIAAGLLGQRMGKTIAIRGGRYFTRVGLIAIIIGTYLLSNLVGLNVWLIAISLLVAYIGFPFLQSATAELISGTLSKQENGVGIGLFNLTNFFAGAFSSAVLAKWIDKETSLAFSFMPDFGEISFFNDIYFVLAMIGVGTLFVFEMRFKVIER